MLKQNQIFIHIPKTGGTTLNCLFFGENTPINPNYNYRHIVYETKMSNSADIFNPLKNDKYLGSEIFMMLRHPVDRLISEYYFLRERSEFINLLKPKPNNFKDYVNNKQTANYTISFLLGYKIFDKKAILEEDYEMIINAIKKLDIKIGIYEQFTASMNYFSQELKISIPKKITSKRITINRPKTDDIGIELEKAILEKNDFDLKLYNFAFERFNSLNIKNLKNITFVGDKYDYAKIYSNRFSLFELTLKDKNFIQKNIHFFQNLKNELDKLNIENGKLFFENYILATYEAIKDAHPKLKDEALNSYMYENYEPLKKLEKLSSYIDNNIKKISKQLEFKTHYIKYSENKINGILNYLIKKLK